MIDIINERVRRLHSDGYISDSTLQFLLINCNARAGRFYLLPKIHKKNCPGRPVISGCNTPTEKISAFVDHQLKSLVPQIPSYVKDTNGFLARLKDMEMFPTERFWPLLTWSVFTPTFLMMKVWKLCEEL